MSDFGLYQALENKLSQTLPQVHIFGQVLPDASPPYIALQLNPIERSPMPQKAGRMRTTVSITSRYKGEAEIQDLHQKILNALEGTSFVLQEGAAGLVRFEESEIKNEKDGVTRTAFLIFTILIRLK